MISVVSVHIFRYPDMFLQFFFSVIHLYNDIFYIDMNEHFCDDDGNLLAEMTGDGVHLYGSYYSRWTDAVLENAVIRSEEDYQE